MAQLIKDNEARKFLDALRNLCKEYDVKSLKIDYVSKPNAEKWIEFAYIEHVGYVAYLKSEMGFVYGY